jgi:hypothetical protein
MVTPYRSGADSTPQALTSIYKEGLQTIILSAIVLLRGV